MCRLVVMLATQNAAASGVVSHTDEIATYAVVSQRNVSVDFKNRFGHCTVREGCAQQINSEKTCFKTNQLEIVTALDTILHYKQNMICVVRKSCCRNVFRLLFCVFRACSYVCACSRLRVNVCSRLIRCCI